MTFGSSSCLDRIGTLCFYGCGLVEFQIQLSLRAICGRASAEGVLTGGVICHDGCVFRAFDGLVLSHNCDVRI